jgi:hypothetical protein
MNGQQFSLEDRVQTERKYKKEIAMLQVDIIIMNTLRAKQKLSHIIQYIFNDFLTDF